ncbi:MAG: DUF6691 family protein [Polyangiaceae bacterium]
MTTNLRTTATLVLTGAAMGFTLSRAGFSSWDQVHGMFVFREPRLFLVFGATVALLAVSWAVIAKVWRPNWSPRKIHKGTVLGGALFGAGWAITGACPSIALVSLGEGQLATLVTLAGILVGNALYGEIHRRWLRWSSSSCVDD